MDANTLMKIVMSSNSTEALGKLAGASSEQVTSVLTNVMPLLLNGASEQATGKDTAASFAKAIEDHADADTRDLGSFLGKVDAADGAKIIKHLLGGNLTGAIKVAMKSSGLSEKAVKTILTSVAPLLLSILGQQQKKHGNTGSELLVSVLTGTIGKNLNAGSILGTLGKLLS